MKRLLWFFLLWPLGLFGCGGNTFTSGVGAAPGVSLSVDEGIEAQRRLVLSLYYPDSLVAQMQSDATPIASQAVGFRPFSTAQYGQRFVLASIPRVYDVFDARIPANLERFHGWAAKNGLVLSQPPTLTYWTYAQAATRFLREFGFDAVLFRPDEYHPVFTLETDTWMFLREDGVAHSTPVQGGEHYTSARIQQRHIGIRGGMELGPIDSPLLWPFYVPNPGVSYNPYQAVTNPPIDGSASPQRLNPYLAQPASSQQLARRAAEGFGVSPLSGRTNLPVGTWSTPSGADSFVSNGFYFDYYSGLQDRYTWGSSGHYLLVLDPEFWN